MRQAMGEQTVLQAPDIADWRAGNTGTEGVWHFDSGRPGRSVMITALVHGNELCGAWTLCGLLAAGVRPVRGQLTLAFCNLEAFDRFDPADHDASRFVQEDLNRQWSVQRMQTASSSERRRAGELQPHVERADWLLDLHSMHEPGPALLLTGPHARNVELARALGTPASIVVDRGHSDGVRMRDFGRFGLDDEASPDTRSLLVECGFHLDPASRDVAQDLSLRFLVQAGILEENAARAGWPGWWLPAPPAQAVLEVTGAVVARSERFRFSQPWRALEAIAIAGTVVGQEDGMPVLTPHHDCVLVMPSTRQARAGVTVVRFARHRLLS
jgi:predicted deacylase